MNAKAKARIRPFQPADQPAIDDIVKLIWHIGLNCLREKQYGFLIGGKTWQERKVEEIHQAIAAEPDGWYVTEIDGRVIGFCSFSADPAAGIGHVGQNGIHPDFKGQGYGARQLEFVLDQLRQRGMKIVEVNTGLNEGHAPARRMYERAGFIPLFDSRIYWRKL